MLERILRNVSEKKIKKKIIIVAAIILIAAIILMFGIKSEKINIKRIASKFTNVYQYYDENTVFVLYTKYLDENQVVLSPTTVKTQTIDNLDYEIDILEIAGYSSTIQELKGTLDQEGIEYLESLDYVRIIVKDNIYNIYVTVNYTAAPSSYTIVHYEQNSDLTGYTQIKEEVIGKIDDEYTGEIVTGQRVTISAEEKEGFSLNTEKTKLSGKVEAYGAKTFEIYYDRNPYYLYTYNTGDSYYEPIQIKYGQTLNLVDEPTYSGYVFDGWKYFKTMNGEEIEKPETMPAYDLYAEAQWKRDATHYTLSYYTENANDSSYTNIGTYQVSATSGDNLSETDLTSIIEEGFASVRGNTAEFYHYNEEKTKENNNNFDVVVEGKGITVVAIYYDRNVYNVELNFNDSSYSTKSEIEINDVTYTDSYTFQAKYDQDITSLWVNADHFTQFPVNNRKTMYFRGWKPSWSTSTYTSMRITLTSDLIEDSTNGSTQLYNAQYTDTNTTTTLYYMFESFDQETTETSDTRKLYNGKYYDSEDAYYQTVYSNSTNWSAKQLAGVTTVGKENDGSNYYFYYDRDVYTITLYNMNSVHIEKELKYGQSMEEFIDTELNPEDFNIETPGTKDWTFEGWYEDSNYMIPMVWTNEDGTYKTINDNLVLYAKWSAPTYTVTFNLNGGTWTDTDSKYVKVDDNTYTLTVEEGTSLTKPQDPTKVGNICLGWYYDVDSNNLEYLFSDSQKVYSDLVLNLKYQTNANVSYKVRYIEAQYENGKLVEDVSQYTNIVDLQEPKEVHDNMFGATVTEYPVDIYDSENADNYFVVNLRSEELTLNSEDIDDNVMYFLYAKNPTLAYTVYHVKYQEDDQGNPITYDYGEIPPDSEILGKSTGVVSAAYVTARAQEINGWTINGAESQTLPLVLKEELNTMYFYYDENALGEYTVNFFFMDENGKYSETPTYTYNSEDGAGKVLYASDFDKFVWQDGATDTDYAGRQLDVDKCGDAYLIVTTTSEISAMDLYFENRTDLSYTVKYVDEEGNSLISDKLVENQTYLSTIKENAETIDGYELIDGESIEKTIQIDVSGNEIVFNYEKRSDLSYSIKYLNQNSGEEIKKPTIIENQTFLSEVTENAIDIEGYKIVGDTSKTITINTTGNEFVFYYEIDENKTKELNYTVEYYKDGKIAEGDTQTVKTTVQILEPDTLTVDKTQINLDDKYVGYKVEKTEPESIPDTVNNGDVIKVYYVKNQFEYTVEYYYDNVIDDEKTVTLTATYQDVIEDYEDKNITGYKLQKTENLPLTVSENSANNVIKVYYIVDNGNTKDLSYTVEYYKDGKIVEEDTQTVKTTVQILEPDTLTVDKTQINLDDKYVGYKVEKTEPESIPDTVNNGDVIKVYYVKNQFEYRIEYYYDNVLDESKTDTGIATYQEEISEYEDKNIFGYMFDKTENRPLIITENKEENVLKVYYIIDPNNTKDLSYTVEYYKDGQKVEEDTQIQKNTVQVLQPDTLTVDKSQINTQNKYIGYKLDTVNTSIPNTINNGEIIKVYYVKNQFNYTVEYYYNGVIDNEKTVVQKATYEEIITDYEDKNILGYRLEKTEGTPLKITEKADNNIIKVYYIIDDGNTKTLNYTIEYYKDGEIQLGDIKTVSQTVQVLEPDTMVVDKTQINTKDKYIGYKLEKTEPAEIPEIITSGDTIKVYYVKNQFEYRVEYYYENEIDANQTETFTETYDELVDSYTDKVKEKYELNRVENLPLRISENPDKNIIKVYYEKKKSTITVHYYIENTKISVSEDVVITDKIDSVHDILPGKDVASKYELVTPFEVEKITMTEAPIELTYYYKLKKAQVIVQHIDKLSQKVLKTETINGIIGDTYNTKDALINGYGLIGEDNPSNSKGKMAELKTIVKYYYIPVSGTPLTNNGESNGNTENSVVKKATNAKKSNKKDAGNEVDYPSTGDNLPVITISVMLIVVMANILQIRLELLNSRVKIKRNKQAMKIRKTRRSNISRIERNCSKHAKIKVKSKGKGRRAK